MRLVRPIRPLERALHIGIVAQWGTVAFLVPTAELPTLIGATAAVWALATAETYGFRFAASFGSIFLPGGGA